MILAIETSTPKASLALLDQESGEEIWQATFESDRLHNAKIFHPVSEALEISQRQLHRIVVGLGPGSYSGVRVGISVANGLGLALNAPVTGLASIAVLSDEDEYVVTGDARRSSYYLAHIHNRHLENDPELMDESQWREKMEALQKQGLKIYSTEKTLVMQNEDAIELKQPEALELAKKAVDIETTAEDQGLEPSLQPIYLRAPYITQPK